MLQSCTRGSETTHAYAFQEHTRTPIRIIQLPPTGYHSWMLKTSQGIVCAAADGKSASLPAIHGYCTGWIDGIITITNTAALIDGILHSNTCATIVITSRLHLRSPYKTFKAS